MFGVFYIGTDLRSSILDALNSNINIVVVRGIFIIPYKIIHF